MKTYFVSGQCRISFGMYVEAKNKTEAMKAVKGGVVWQNHILENAGTPLKSTLSAEEF